MIEERETSWAELSLPTRIFIVAWAGMFFFPIVMALIMAAMIVVVSMAWLFGFSISLPIDDFFRLAFYGLLVFGAASIIKQVVLITVEYLDRWRSRVKS